MPIKRALLDMQLCISVIHVQRELQVCCSLYMQHATDSCQTCSFFSDLFCTEHMHVVNIQRQTPKMLTSVHVQASASSLFMPKPEVEVAHGDATLSVNDFLTRAFS